MVSKPHPLPFRHRCEWADAGDDAPRGLKTDEREDGERAAGSTAAHSLSALLDCRFTLDLKGDRDR